eukprot:3796229-Pyramimonas_sp.AAC.1
MLLSTTRLGVTKTSALAPTQSAHARDIYNNPNCLVCARRRGRRDGRGDTKASARAKQQQ